VFFVIDYLDKNRLDEARDVFQSILHNPSLSNAVKVVILNVKGPVEPDDSASSRIAAMRVGCLFFFSLSCSDDEKVV